MKFEAVLWSDQPPQRALSIVGDATKYALGLRLNNIAIQYCESIISPAYYQGTYNPYQLAATSVTHARSEVYPTTSQYINFSGGDDAQFQPLKNTVTLQANVCFVRTGKIAQDLNVILSLNTCTSTGWRTPMQHVARLPANVTNYTISFPPILTWGWDWSYLGLTLEHSYIDEGVTIDPSKSQIVIGIG